MPEAFAAAGGLGGKVLANAQSPQFCEPAFAGLPLFPRVTSQAALNPTVEAPQHRWGLARAEVAVPSQQVATKFTDHAL